MTIFLISDTHFDHKNILKFEEHFRPFKDVNEMNETLISNWNKTVGPNDEVYHVGDFAFGNKFERIGKRLNGHKYLVLGNHDNTNNIQMYMDAGFSEFYGMVKLDNYILTHCPMHDTELMYYPGKKNVHGHIHSRLVFDKNKPNLDYINVSVELTGHKPIALDELEKYQKLITNDVRIVNHAYTKQQEDARRVLL